MSDLCQYNGAEVVVLRVPARIIETEIWEIRALFPGWYVWYSDWSETWNAHREDAKPYFGPVPNGAQMFMVSAYHASDLVAMLEDQVRVDITVEFPDWRVRQSPGSWCAIGPQGPQTNNGAAVQLVYCPGIADVLRALRARCTTRAKLHGA